MSYPATDIQFNDGGTPPKGGGEVMSGHPVMRLDKSDLIALWAKD